MAYSIGTKLTTDFNSSRRKDIIGDKIFEPFKNTRKFLRTISALNRKDVSTTKPSILVNRPLWTNKTFYVNSATPPTWSSGSLSALTIDDGKGGSIDFVRQFDTVIIKHAAGGVTVAIVESVGAGTIDLVAVSASPTNPADNDQIQIIGSAHHEYQTSVTNIKGEPDIEYSYTEIFIDPVKISGSAEAESHYGGPELTRMKAEAMKNHVTDINRSFLLSDRGLKTVSIAGNNEQVRTTYGLVNYVLNNSSTAHVFTPAYASYTYDDFIDDMESLVTSVDDGSGFYAIAGSSVVSFVSKMNGFFKDATFNVENKTNAAGVEIMNILTPHGNLELMPEFGLNPMFSDWLLVFPKDYVGYAPLVGNGKNRDTQYIEDFVPGGDGRTDVYLTEVACLPRLPEGFALFQFS